MTDTKTALTWPDTSRQNLALPRKKKEFLQTKLEALTAKVVEIYPAFFEGAKIIELALERADTC